MNFLFDVVAQASDKKQGFFKVESKFSLPFRFELLKPGALSRPGVELLSNLPTSVLSASISSRDMDVTLPLV